MALYSKFYFPAQPALILKIGRDKENRCTRAIHTSRQGSMQSISCHYLIIINPRVKT